MPLLKLSILFFTAKKAKLGSEGNWMPTCYTLVSSSGNPTGLWDSPALLQQVCSGAPARTTVCPPWTYWNPGATSPGTALMDHPGLHICPRWELPGSHSDGAADPSLRILLCLGKFAKSSHQQLPLTWPNINRALLVHICALGESDPLLDKRNKLLSWGAWADGNK